MTEFVIRVPKELLKGFPEMSHERWERVFSRLINERLERIREVDRIVSKSKATQKQADELAREVNKAVWKRYERLLRQEKGAKASKQKALSLSELNRLMAKARLTDEDSTRLIRRMRNRRY